MDRENVVRLSIAMSSVAVIGSSMASPAYADGGVRFISSDERASNPFVQAPAAPIAFNAANPGYALPHRAATAGFVNGAGGAALLQNTADTPSAGRSGEGAVQPVGEVPELTTWAMMLVGLGAIGYAMRRRPEDEAFS